MTYSGCVRLAAVLVLACATGLACGTKEVPQVVGTSTGGSGGSGLAQPDAPAGSASDSVLAPGEGCLAADAPKRAPGQACNCPTDCTTSVCQEGVCCSGAACGAKRPAGSTCNEPGDCESGFCTDGVCCNVACTGACVSCNQPDHMGECIPSPAGAKDPHNLCRLDAPETCGQSGFCNGQGGCAKFAQGSPCKLGSCEGREKFLPNSVCDGNGTCLAGIAISCAPSTCENGICLTTCSNSSQCMAPAVCTGGSCGKRGNGQDCTDADQCGSGFCVEGVCCQGACAGPCQTCALPSARGQCSPAPANATDPKGMCRDLGAAMCGDNGKCNGMGACQKYPNGTVCQGARCDATANSETPAGLCQNGACSVPTARSCAPHRGCNGSVCVTSCGSDAQCTTGNVCVTGTCGKRPNGATCNAGTQCTSGQCAQGRCCATACTGSCRSCALPGQEGTCANVPARGADPAGLCSDGACTNGCDGAGGCLREPLNSSCGSARCGGAGTRILRVCDASGACVDRPESCPTTAPNCADTGICRGNNCTSSNCPAPCRACVMDQCVDAPPGTGCPNGQCNAGTCTPTCTPQTCAGNRAECQGGACVGTCSAANCAGPCSSCGTNNRSCNQAANESNCPGGVCRDGSCVPGTDCMVSDWGEWGTCSRTCGGGMQTRTRTVTRQPTNGGMPCPTLTETRACNTDPCPMPVDCQVSAWSDWSACSKTCGGGTQTRTRTVIQQPQNGGTACPALTETQACNTTPCPECENGQKECVDSDTRRDCNNGRWRMMNCNGRTPVCVAGDCVEAPPP